MPLLRYTENIGTILNDSLTGTASTVTYGSHGNDARASTANQDETVLVGGNGNDSYTIAAGSFTTIGDLGNSGGDTLYATNSFFNNLYSGTIDNLHLYAYDETNGTEVIILNWLDTANKIETIHIADATFTTDELSATLTTLPGYVGNFTWEELEGSRIVPDGFTGADIREAISCLLYTSPSPRDPE